MIAIIDYGVGNLFSLKSSFAILGKDAVVTSDPAVLAEADRLILPGVGAFGDAAKKLRDSGLDRVVKDLTSRGKPLLGICLGMQMLFEKSYEYGEHEGLGLIKGAVKPIRPVIGDALKVPHIGWNALHLVRKEHPLLRGINEGDFVYFVHSYYARDCEESLLAVTEYDKPITAAVAKDNVMGCQFHPEKSGNVGLNMLKAFCDF